MKGKNCYNCAHLDDEGCTLHSLSMFAINVTTNPCKDWVSKEKEITLDELFNADADFKADTDFPMRTCKTCKHRQRWQCNSKVFQYCAVRKSKRTFNGHLKIKCKQPACGMYQEDKK